MTTLPNKSDPAAMERARDDLRATYGAVMKMRDWFEDTFNSYVRKPRTETESLNPAARAIYETLNNNPIKFQGFSDSLVVWVSMRKTDDVKLPIRAVLGVLAAAALASVGCLMKGHPIRGGIDLGLGFETPTGDIYGPALSRAYTLESEIANYPRVVVGEELQRFLNLNAANPSSEVVDNLSKQVAQQCIQCLAEDDDGVPFVDYLGPFYHDLLSTMDGGFVDAAYTVVVDSCERFKKERNSKLAFRYTLLRNYFEERKPDWDDLPREREDK